MERIKATDVCSKFSIGDRAQKLLTPELNAKQFIDLLVQNKLHIEAIRVLAYGLPIRTAIFWANWCARYFAQEKPSDKCSAASDAVDKWLNEPTDENRRAASVAAKTAGFDTPGGSAALAVFLSGGSIAPPDAPAAEPLPYMAQNSVAESVLLAAILNEPEKAESKWQMFLEEGLKLAIDAQPKGTD